MKIFKRKTPHMGVPIHFQLGNERSYGIEEDIVTSYGVGEVNAG